MRRCWVNSRSLGPIALALLFGLPEILLKGRCFYVADTCFYAHGQTLIGSSYIRHSVDWTVIGYDWSVYFYHSLICKYRCTCVYGQASLRQKCDAT